MTKQVLAGKNDWFGEVRHPVFRIGLIATLAWLIFFGVNAETLFWPGPLEETMRQDYPAFFVGAQAGISGSAEGLYDPESMQSALGTQTGLLWLYPPTMLILLAPLGLLPFWALKLIIVPLMLLIIFGLCRWAAGSRLIGILGIVSPASFAILHTGQIAALFALLFAGGLVNSRDRPVLSGLCLGLLTIKPQYGLLVIPFLIAMKAWKAMGWAAVVAFAIAGLSVLIYGLSAWIDFFASIREGAHAEFVASSGHPGRYTAADALMALGLESFPSVLVYGGLLTLAGLAMFRLAGQVSTRTLAAFTMLATAATSPYLLMYDFLFVHISVLVIAASVPRISAWHAVPLVALWFVPLGPYIAAFFQGTGAYVPAVAWPLTALGTFAAWLALIRRHDKHALTGAPFTFRSI